MNHLEWVVIYVWLTQKELMDSFLLFLKAEKRELRCFSGIKHSQGV